ncbi:MAG TPA: PhnD/SsuA/transferrin family substrate-binding protein [Acidiferrobacterales bacterium]|nr:PhnD/SsuA/transferrin family substrate-binding protein [Acidiferrobacterales bacterium]
MIGHSSSTFGKSSRFSLALVLASACAGAAAESGGQAAATGTKVAFRTPQNTAPAIHLTENNELVLSAAPREDDAEAEAIYGPVAGYLSTVLGKKVVFRHAGNWGVYQGLMQKGAYDIVFDGPHFNSWRVDRVQHNVLAKVPGDHVFVALVKKDNDKIRELKQLAGRTICGHAPPNLGTLTALNEFENPARQPIIVNIDGWKNIYQGMLAGKCVAAVVPVKALEKFEKDTGRQAKIVFRGAALPDNAFSAGPRLSVQDQEKIARALFSPEGEKATLKLREKYAAGKPFSATSNKEFAGLGNYLKNEWGY